LNGVPHGHGEEITMSRKKSLAKKSAEEVRVNWVVDLVDPPQRVAEPAELEPEREPDRVDTEERFGDVNLHLAKALEIATAECARLAEKGTTLAAELEEANKQLLTNKTRAHELEGVLKRIDRLASSAVTEEEEPAEGSGEPA
jgi:hypothetical protein